MQQVAVRERGPRHTHWRAPTGALAEARTTRGELRAKNKGSEAGQDPHLNVFWPHEVPAAREAASRSSARNAEKMPCITPLPAALWPAMIPWAPTIRRAGAVSWAVPTPWASATPWTAAILWGDLMGCVDPMRCNDPTGCGDRTGCDDPMGNDVPMGCNDFMGRNDPHGERRPPWAATASLAVAILWASTVQLAAAPPWARTVARAMRRSFCLRRYCCGDEFDAMGCNAPLGCGPPQECRDPQRGGTPMDRPHRAAKIPKAAELLWTT